MCACQQKKPDQEWLPGRAWKIQDPTSTHHPEGRVLVWAALMGKVATDPDPTPFSMGFNGLVTRFVTAYLIQLQHSSSGTDRRRCLTNGSCKTANPVGSGIALVSAIAIVLHLIMTQKGPLFRCFEGFLGLFALQASDNPRCGWPPQLTTIVVSINDVPVLFKDNRMGAVFTC